ncbi:MAG TPA: nucleoside deaminase, partial [Devosia sp.]|nr:nucleoside deaminase [Devosia sp.]
MDTPALVTRLLDVIETDLAPMSRRRIAEGDKIFGAAILRKDDLSLVVGGTNHET